MVDRWSAFDAPFLATALVRAGDRDEAQRRIDRVLELLFGRADAHAGRVIALPGDIEHDGLGLTSADRDVLESRAGEIVHCAATASFVAGLEESRLINVSGTRHVLDLAEQCACRGRLRRLVHVSTAYGAPWTSFRPTTSPTRSSNSAAVTQGA